MSHDKETYLSSEQEHAWAEQQIPWLVNETLESNAVARVQRHIRECKLCREDLRRQQKLRELLAIEAKVDYTPQASWQRMQALMEHPSFLNQWRRRIGAILTWRLPTINFWQAIIGTQAVTVLVLTVVVWLQFDSQAVIDSQPVANYRTLSSPNLHISEPHLQVVFDEQLSLINIRQMLASIDAVIASGPSEQGIFRVSVSQVDHIQAHADWLASQPGVVFVAVQGE